MQNDVQCSSSSNVRQILSRVQYELATVQQTVQSAEQARTQRTEEKAAELKALAAWPGTKVNALKAKDRELTDRLATLRGQFTKVRQKEDNLGLVRKAVR